MENNSITEQLELGVISCMGCDEDKSKQFKLHLMNISESRKGKEMSDMVKTKRQDLCTAAWRAKSKSSVLTQEELQKECNEEDRMAQSFSRSMLKDLLLTEIHLDAQRRLKKTCSEQYPSLPLIVLPCYRQKFLN